MGLKGDLQYMSLTNLIQMVCMDRMEVRLVVKNRTAGEGSIFFSKGQIVHAKVGALSGEEALYQLLSWPDGVFEMRDASAPVQTIHAPWSQLLMNGMRLIDEQIVDRAIEEIEARQELLPEEIEQDSRLEQDLIVVLSKVEQMAVQITAPKTRKRPTAGIQLLAAIIRKIAAFAKKLPGEASSAGYLAHILTQVSKTCPSIKLLRVENDALAVHIVTQLYNNWSGSPAERKQTFEEIGAGMVALVEIYFAYLVGAFHSSALAGQWHETCEIFLTELKQGVNRIQF